MTKEENEARLAHLRNIAASLPSQPGSYQYYDREGTIIYVGKAKNLKNRVSSYFHKEVDRFKTKVLVSKIWNITYTVVNTEEDALLLENSLIKKYQPKYNILLKDGKTYPSICITKEHFPRIFSTRNINRKWGQYFGPYSNVGTMYGLLDIIKELYHPRTCRFPITQEGIKEGKYKPCLEYHIHNCEGPCIGKQTSEDYQQNIAQAREILKGNTREVQKMLYEKMLQAAEELRFEDAEVLKGKYNLLEKFASKSEVVSHTITNVDVFTLTEDDTRAYINYMHVTNGAINQAFTYEFKKKLNETADDILTTGIMQIREQVGSDATEIILPFEPETRLPNVTITVPCRGDKKHLLELSAMNGRQYRFDRLKQAEKLNPEQKQTRLMKELQNALGMRKMPYHIECFDNSNISGSDAVAGCVVFKGLKPSKADYRKYNIKTVEGPDDYASMKEVVRRRYTRLKEEKQPLPDLIITDGGKGQMEVVRQVVEDEMRLDIAIAGLAKNDRHRTNELLFGFPAAVVGIKTDSELFRVLTRIQDEVHRYAITFHREKRSKHALHSELDDIRGIGPKTKELLIKELKSAKQIKTADLQILTKTIGASKANILYEYFHKSDNV
ncbi:excinuclease ABC subunit UvrC [Prevotella sp. OH937_COT-195]|uniref:excinuclease ABC subunit UvrC n=1 Tax=Prevotella sp. OH937_COT-195 TaxID=2491051 RepID=UPI000F64E52C|nr:excinuclease ABC subunit UvrC [Prevotella sp. OH937_COT-195]RRD00945.1 excinuclease ABC subunit UvrC [Prevotella sp. OH937_COT-195]